MDELVAAGWNRGMAEALHENDHTVESAKYLSVEEAMDLYLTWNGIIWYTSSIIDAVDNCRNMGAV